MSQVELAEKIGLTQPDISKIERLERRLDVIEFLDIQHALLQDDEELLVQFWKDINECYCKHTPSKKSPTSGD